MRLFGMLGKRQKASLLSALVGMIGGGGTLGAIVGNLQSGGLGDQLSSWLGTGPNKVVDVKSLSSAVGPDLLTRLAGRSGLSTRQTSKGLAELLPSVIDKLSPNGILLEGDAFTSALNEIAPSS